MALSLGKILDRFFRGWCLGRARLDAPLTPGQIAWARRFITVRTFPDAGDKPLVILCPWRSDGDGSHTAEDVEFWDSFVARWNGRVRFWQFGRIGQGAVQGCEYYHLVSSRSERSRKTAALVNEAVGFVGVESGASRAAETLARPSLVLPGAGPGAAAESGTKLDAYLEGLLR